MTSDQRPYQSVRRCASRAFATVPLVSHRRTPRGCRPPDLDKLLAAANSEGARSVNGIFATTVESELMHKFGAKYKIKARFSRGRGAGPAVQKIYSEARSKQYLAEVVTLEKSGNIILKNEVMLESYSVPADRQALSHFRTDDKPDELPRR